MEAEVTVAKLESSLKTKAHSIVPQSFSMTWAPNLKYVSKTEVKQTDSFPYAL